MSLAEALASGRPLLADGGLGSTLLASGLAAGVAPERWVVERPDEVAALHRQFVSAGADIILTNTFGANRRRLAGTGLERDLRALNGRAAGLARRAAAAAGRPVVVAGSVGPTGDRPGTPEWPSLDDLVAIFAEQVEGLADGGAAVAWFETLSCPLEMIAAAAAAAGMGLPFVVTANFSRAGRTLLDLTPSAIAGCIDDLPARPLAFGANCGTGPDDMLPVVSALAAARTGVPVVAKPNAGLPSLTGGRLVYPAGYAAMAAFAGEAVARGASIVGGCCGASPAHIGAMRRALDAWPG